MKSNLVDIDVQLHHETDRAWLVSTDGERDTAIWVPKSQGELEVTTRTNVWILTAPEPLLIEKGLV